MGVFACYLSSISYTLEESSQLPELVFRLQKNGKAFNHITFNRQDINLGLRSLVENRMKKGCYYEIHRVSKKGNTV